MKHETAIAHVGDLARGRLDDVTSREVLAHLQDCDECRAMSETYLTLAQTFGAGQDASSERHPDSSDIVRYATEVRDLSDTERVRMERHLKECVTCAMEVEATQGAHRDLRSVATEPGRDVLTASSGGRRAGVEAAIAASIALAVLSYPAYIGLVEKPQMEERLRSQINLLQSAAEGESSLSWSGPVELTLLQPPLRGQAAEIAVVRVPQGQPFLPLAVVPDLGQTLVADASIRFEVQDQAGAVVWTRDATQGEVERYAASSGVVTFMIPAESMPAGDYSLRVAAAETADRPLFEVPFRVER